mgnify:FL=1
MISFLLNCLNLRDVAILAKSSIEEFPDVRKYPKNSVFYEGARQTTTKATIDKEEILLILSTKVLIPCKIIKVNKTFSNIRRKRTLKRQEINISLQGHQTGTVFSVMRILVHS